MVNSNKKVCRLCFKYIDHDKVQTMDEIKKEMLGVLLIILDWSVIEENVLCDNCSKCIEETFKFKCNCILIDDFMTPFLKRRKKSDLKKLNLIKTEKPILYTEKQNICRLCMILTENDSVALNKNDQLLFQKYLPEINLATTLDPTICSTCNISLQNYFNFVEACLEWEAKLTKYCKLIRRRINRFIFLDKFLQHEERSNRTDITEQYFSTDHNSELDIKHEIFLSETKQSDGEESSDEEVGEKMYYCDVCSYSTRSRTYMKMHKRTHRSNANTVRYKCPECTLEVKHEISLKRHIQTAHRDEIFSCYTCDFTTKHKISIRRHVSIHQISASHKCNNCFFRTKDEKKFISHVCKQRAKNSKIYHECKICNRTFDKINNYKRHMLTHDQPKKEYRCDQCTFVGKKNLARHKRTHENSPDATIYQCSFCEFQTFSTVCLKIHLKTHEDYVEMKEFEREKYIINLKDAFKCTECDFQAKLKIQLVRHKRVHKAKVKCVACPFETKREYELIQHMKIHNGTIEMHTCNICGFNTKTKVLLKSHMTTHTDASQLKTYKCDKCAFETKWKTSYTNHINLHKDSATAKFFKCPDCDFQTKHRRSMLNHPAVHDKSGIKTYECLKCPFKTKWQLSLRNHMRFTHSKANYKCTKCSFRTKYERSLRHHLRDMHKGPKRMIAKTHKGFRCTKCKYKTDGKHRLVEHVRNVHETAGAKPVWYRCKQCPFKTKWLSSYKKHPIIHQDTSLLKMYKCKKCDYETRYARCLRNHVSSAHTKKLKVLPSS